MKQEDLTQMKFDSFLEQSKEVEKLLTKGVQALRTADDAFSAAKSINEGLKRQLQQERNRLEKSRAAKILQNNDTVAESVATETADANGGTNDQVEDEDNSIKSFYQKNPRLQHIFDRK